MCCTWKWGISVSCCLWWRAARNHYVGKLAHEQTVSVARRCRETCGSNIIPDQKLFLANGEHSESFVPGLEQKSSCFGENLHGPEAMEALHRSGAGPVPPVSPWTHMVVATITCLPFLQRAAKWKVGLRLCWSGVAVCSSCNPGAFLHTFTDRVGQEETV